MLQFEEQMKSPYCSNMERSRFEQLAGEGSTQMHKALKNIISNSNSRDELLKGLGYWANHWMDDGLGSVPPTLKDPILATGG